MRGNIDAGMYSLNSAFRLRSPHNAGGQLMAPAGVEHDGLGQLNAMSPV
jgi:hypothetical protein